MKSLFFYLIFIIMAFPSLAEEGFVVESKIVKQEFNKEEINRLKLRLSEIEKNQKYILETISQKNYTSKAEFPTDINQKLDMMIQNQKDLNSKIDNLEKYIRKQILLQNIIQFIIFAIFLVFMILLSKHKKEATKIEDKIDDVSTKIEENKKETIRLLIEKAKDDPKLTLALKSILEEKQSEK